MATAPQLLIGGEWVDGGDGAYEVVNPATEEVLARPVDMFLATTGIGMRTWFAAADEWGLADPLVAALFLISAFSLAGLPPFSGFFAKLVLIRAGFEIQQYLIIAVSLVVSIMTLFSMTKIWTEAFWKAPPHKGVTPAPTGLAVGARAGGRLMLIPIVGLAGITILMGLGMGPLMNLVTAAAEQLLNPSTYVRVVLGG